MKRHADFRKYSYKDIYRALEDEYGIRIRRSSVGRYAKQVGASRIMGVEIPRQIYIDTGEGRLPIYR